MKRKIQTTLSALALFAALALPRLCRPLAVHHAAIRLRPPGLLLAAMPGADLSGSDVSGHGLLRRLLYRAAGYAQHAGAAFRAGYARSAVPAGQRLRPRGGARVVSLVNEIRAQYGLSALTLDESLCRYARVKSQDMQQNGYFSHESPTYGSPFDMMRSFGISIPMPVKTSPWAIRRHSPSWRPG